MDFFDDSQAGMDKTLVQLEENVQNGYKKALFIFDSLAFFLNGDLYDEKKINQMLVLFKKIRRAGGTIIIIAHATKSGNMFRGSSNLVNAVDELWEVEKMPSLENELNFVATPFKQRLNLKVCGFNVKTSNCDLRQVDPNLLIVKDEEQEAIENIKNELEDKDYSQSQLLKALGKTKGDRAYLRVLKRFDGIYWFSTLGKNRSIVYSREKR